MALKRYAVEVSYTDRRDGPSRWRGTVEAGGMRVAFGRGVREFFRKASFRGRDPHRRLSLVVSKLKE